MNFSMTEGDTKYIEIELDESEQSLAGSTLKWGFDNVVKTASLSGNIFTIKLVPEDTEGLRGTFRHEGELTDAQENVSTVIKGMLTIEKGNI